MYPEPLTQVLVGLNVHFLVYLPGAIVDIYPSIKNIQLFQFGTGSSNGLDAQNLLEKLEEFPANAPNEIHKKSIEGTVCLICTT